MNPEKQRIYLQTAEQILKHAKEQALTSIEVMCEMRRESVSDQTPLDVHFDYCNGFDHIARLENLVEFLQHAGKTSVVANGSEVYIEILSDGEISFSGRCLIYDPGEDPSRPFSSVSGIPPIFSSRARVIKSIFGLGVNPDVYYPDPQDEKSKVRICSIE